MTKPTLDDIRAAAERIEPYVHCTPVFTCKILNEMSGAELFFKCENLQKIGAFKIRGATNAVLQLSEDQARRGVATHSSGNHAAALALAARNRGIPAHVVMPENAPAVKRAAVAGNGAEIITCKATLDARETTLAEVIERSGAYFIHPYNDLAVIAGQGTVALELMSDQPDLDCIIAPVGGGGLLSGSALATKGLQDDISVFGAEPLQAGDAYRSLQAGRIIPPDNPNTIADGLRTALGDLTFPIIQNQVDAVITVTEEQIIQAMRLLWERMKLVVEPSGAVPLAAVLTDTERFKRRRVGVILSGGNVDLDHLPWK